MFQHLFGKWKVWQILALMMLVVTVVIATTVILAGTERECPVSVSVEA